MPKLKLWQNLQSSFKRHENSRSDPDRSLSARERTTPIFRKVKPYGGGGGGGVTGRKRSFMDLAVWGGTFRPLNPPRSTNPGITFAKKNPLSRGAPMGVDYKFDECNPELWKQLAAYVLEDYCKRKGVELGFSGDVEASVLFYWKMCGFHLFFKALDKNGSLKEVFAEVYQRENGTRLISFCDIMDPNSADMGCRFCSKHVLHPKNMRFFNFRSLDCGSM